MRWLAALILCSCLVAPGAYAKNKGPKHKGRPASANIVNVRFDPNDVHTIHQYYGAHPVNLPPGLQKKLARGKPLPPGWQKKLQPFPANIDAGMGPICGYCGRGVIDGYGIIYDKKTAIIMDVVSLVGNVLR